MGDPGGGGGGGQRQLGGAKKPESEAARNKTRRQRVETDPSAKERSRKIVWKFELLLKLRPEMTPTQPTVQRQWGQQTDRDRARLTERVRVRGMYEERATRMPVVVLNKMFAGAISVNSVVLCLLIQLLQPPPPRPLPLRGITSFYWHPKGAARGRK